MILDGVRQIQEQDFRVETAGRFTSLHDVGVSSTQQQHTRAKAPIDSFYEIESHKNEIKNEIKREYR